MLFNKKGKLSNLEISTFCDQLSMVVAAGIAPEDGISILIEDASDDITRNFLTKIHESMEMGDSLGEAMGKTDAFPKYSLDMVNLGFQTGNLDNTLRSLATYYEREEDIRSSIRNAITYPIIMIVMMLAVILVLVIKVLPVFQQIYAELGSGLTGFAGIMMKFSTFFSNYLLIILAVIIAIVVLILLYLRSPSGQNKLKNTKLSLATSRSRFANCVAMGLHSGLMMDQCMELAATLVDNPTLSQNILECKDSLDAGEPFAKSVQKHKILGSAYASLINVGYKTGSVDQVMSQIGKSYENEADNRINHFISLLEPTLVIILSCIIGLIMLSFLLPLIGIMSNIG